MSSAFPLEEGKAEISSQSFAVSEKAQEIEGQTQRLEHYAFLEEQGSDKDVAKQAGEALQTAHLNAAPKQVFQEIGGFSVDLDEQEAEQLRQVPCIKSCEADQPLELTDPIESEEAEGLVQPATAVETPAPGQTAFNGRVIDGSQQQVESSQEITTDALTSYGDSTASSGEILPYGVKAVWGGQDVSTKGNAGEGCYAFVIDSGSWTPQATCWLTRLGQEAGSVGSRPSPMATAMEPMWPERLRP